MFFRGCETLFIIRLKLKPQVSSLDLARSCVGDFRKLSEGISFHAAFVALASALWEADLRRGALSQKNLNDVKPCKKREFWQGAA